MLTYIKTDQPFEAGSRYLSGILHLHKTRPILLLVSGGSAFSLLDILTIPQSSGHITCSVLDERYTNQAEDSNFFQLTQTNFYQEAQQKHWLFWDSRPAKMGLEEAGTLMDTRLKHWRSHNPQGIIIITQGLGSDGHTAGILPFPDGQGEFIKDFSDPQVWALGYQAPETSKNPHKMRLTTTLSFLKEQADYSITVVSGSEKSSALNYCLDPASELSKTPGAIVQQMKKVMLFTDLQEKS